MVHHTDAKQRRTELSIIHAEAQRQGLSEFKRRALQFSLTGHESAVTMNQEERRMVISALREEAKRPAPGTYLDCYLARTETVSDAEALAVLGFA